MDRPTPPSSGPDREPDLPKPPIWDEHRAFDAPDRPADGSMSFPTPDVHGPNAEVHVEPETTTPLPVVPVAPGPVFHPPAAPAVAPASGETISGNRPQWPAAPPVAATPTSPTPPRRSPVLRRRVGLVLAALIALAGLTAGAFVLGRTIGGEEAAMVPVADPTAETAEASTDSDVASPALDPPEAEPTDEPVTPTPETAVPDEPAEPAVVESSPLEVPPPVVPDDAEEPVAAVAEAVAPAVVLIQNDLGQGSGIIYDESGLILTNAHVVGQFSEVSVQLASGKRVPGTVLGADTNTDVAVVRIETDEEFGVAPLAPESTVEVGQLAVAIGSPFGLDQTVTSGIVSATGRVVGTVAMIQTDAPINPGNSGGALADRQGRVIGMNTAIRTDGSGGNVGVGFAIPADTAKLIADRIIAGDSLEQGYLGIEGATPQVGDPGVIVTRVIPDTGAEAAGVQVDDLIVGFAGSDIRSMQDLAAAVRLRAPGASVEVVVMRAGEQITLTVVLGVLPS